MIWLTACVVMAALYFLWRKSRCWLSIEEVRPPEEGNGQFRITVLLRQRALWPWREDEVTRFFAFTQYGNVVCDQQGLRFYLERERHIGNLFEAWLFRKKNPPEA
jgi:hypothetical protein